MFGEILGKIISAPIRIANAPIKLMQKIDGMGEDDMLGLDELAESVQDAVEDTVDYIEGDE
jgi:hypothetical protein